MIEIRAGFKPLDYSKLSDEGSDGESTEEYTPEVEQPPKLDSKKFPSAEHIAAQKRQHHNKHDKPKHALANSSSPEDSNASADTQPIKPTKARKGSLSITTVALQKRVRKKTLNVLLVTMYHTVKRNAIVITKPRMGHLNARCAEIVSTPQVDNIGISILISA